MRIQSSTPSDWLPDADMSTRIRIGVTAENSLKKQFQPWACNVAADQYALPMPEAAKLAKRALTAMINSIRKSRDWKPGLASQLVRDQLFVYRVQQRERLEQGWLDQYYAAAGNYLRNYLYRLGTVLTKHSHDSVLEEAQQRFIDSLLKPDFELTSTLSTYLIGIVKRVIKETERTGLAPFRRTNDPRNKQGQEVYSFISLETIRYFQRAHQLIDTELAKLSSTCQTIILTHYAIDATRMATITQQSAVSEDLREENFRVRFDAAMREPGIASNLKELAPKIGISPKKISDHHIDCLDRLIKAVVPQLVHDPDLTLPDWLRQQLQTRLDTARHRQAKR